MIQLGKRRGCCICNSGANLWHVVSYGELLVEYLLCAMCWNKDDNFKSGYLEVHTLLLNVGCLDIRVALDTSTSPKEK